jgi:hypothetical protein
MPRFSRGARWLVLAVLVVAVVLVAPNVAHAQVAGSGNVWCGADGCLGDWSGIVMAPDIYFIIAAGLLTIAWI